MKRKKPETYPLLSQSQRHIKYKITREYALHVFVCLNNVLYSLRRITKKKEKIQCKFYKSKWKFDENLFMLCLYKKIRNYQIRFCVMLKRVRRPFYQYLFVHTQ